jgi:hypothetical protein
MKCAAKSLALSLFALAIAVSGCSKKESHVYSALKDRAVAAQLKQFVAEKRSQAYSSGDKSTPEFDAFFAAAEKGDWLTVSNQLGHLLNRSGGQRPIGSRLAAVLEVDGALEAFGAGDEKYSALFGNDTINSIPPGSIYFGGTDPGRFVITAMQKSQVNGDPFFTLTQNAMADPTYLDYLRSMYGGKIYTPTAEDSQSCFAAYTQDAQQRLQKHQLKPGEQVKLDSTGHVQVSGQVSVMEINGLICKVICDKNPDREFYIEESFPLDWMYPYLEPHGLIFKLNHQPLTTLSDDMIQRDHDAWTKYTSGMIGDWLHDDTPVTGVADFAMKAFLKNDYRAYGADAQFLKSDHAQRLFSKLRDSIAGLYLWRAEHTSDSAEKERLNDAADFAFRQAFALCPYSPEAVYRYANLLVEQKRWDDALLVAETAAKFKSSGMQFQNLLTQLRRSKTAN